MNPKTNDPIVTKSILEKAVKTLKNEMAINNIDLRAEMDEKFSQAEEVASKRHSELMNLFDDLAGEVKSSREERLISGNQISTNTQRIDKLEKKVFGSIQN